MLMTVHPDETVVKTHDWKLIQASNVKLEKQRDEARKELVAIRTALGGYEDSDLASLVETVMQQRLYLARLVLGDHSILQHHEPDAVALAEAIVEEAGRENA